MAAAGSSMSMIAFALVIAVVVRFIVRLLSPCNRSGRGSGRCV